jgi:hypothetical protein
MGAGTSASLDQSIAPQRARAMTVTCKKSTQLTLGCCCPLRPDVHRRRALQCYLGVDPSALDVSVARAMGDLGSIADRRPQPDDVTS